MAATITITRVTDPDPKVAPYLQVGVDSVPVPPSNAYASNFTAGVDSWGITGAGASRANDTTRAIAALAITGPAYPTYPAGSVATATRAVAGLTVGAQYRLRLYVQTNKGLLRAGVQGIGSTAYVSSITGRSRIDYLFTATATTHTITVDVQLPNPYATTTQAKAWVDTVTVRPSGTWQGNRLYRTDVNGVDVPVRPNNGQTDFDTPFGGFIVADWEAARLGPVTYKVIDGNGLATVSAPVSHAEARRNLLPNPSFEVDTTGWAATSAVLSRDAVEKHSGSASLKVVTAGAGANEGAFFNPIVQPVAAGDKVTISGWVKAPAGQAMQFYCNSLGTGNVPQIVAFVGTGAWQYVQGTVAVGADLKPYVIVRTAGTAAVTFWVDQVLMEKGATAGDYFDGDTPDEPPVYRYWVGAANASASVETDPAGLRPALTIPTANLVGVPAADVALVPELVLDYEEAREFNGSLHTIIGRPDKVANPGPLMLRSGRLDLFCTDYASAAKARDLLTTGATILLTQPTYPGMDMYFIGRSAQVRPAEPTNGVRRWVCSLAYEQVPRP